ncbi:insecticidal delta-endotoxin Cry8Ea1 family protein [Bacillus cereus]|nr:insecticidal delta-endotoxin Cry8Ea1 family protein [Bacillus cereus]
MQYKDRKDAKRKYKQALLITVATMTLGVSTLEGAASAFAEEKETGAQQQAATNSLGAGGGGIPDDAWIKTNSIAKIDTAIQDLGKNTGAANYKTIAGAVEKVLPSLLKDTKAGNYNNTLRSLAMFSTALIPYGGSFISGILGFLWTESSPDMKAVLNEMRKELTELMDQKITEYDLEAINSKVKPLLEELTAFEDELQGTNLTGTLLTKLNGISEYSPLILKVKATIINNLFTQLISETNKEFHKASELPVYTIVASAHLQFLELIKVNGLKPQINMDPYDYNQFVNKIDANTKLYKQHIEETYEEGLQKIQKKMDDIANEGETIKGKTDGERIDFINKQIKYYTVDLGYPRIKLKENIDKANEWKGKLEKFNKLLRSKQNYIQSTVNNVIFNLSTPASWKKLPGSTGYYYIDEYRNMKTRWITDKNNLYYLSPNDNTKNYKGQKFLKGQMVTGWFKDLDQNWYYFYEDGHAAVKNGLTIDGRIYNFNSDGVCTNPYTTQKTAEETKVLSEGTYTITNELAKTNVGSNSDGVYHGNGKNSVALFQKNSQNDSQKWTLKYDNGKKAYQIISNKDPNQVLSWNKIAKNTGDYIIVAPNEHKNEQYWIIEKLNENFYLKNYDDENQYLTLVDWMRSVDLTVSRHGDPFKFVAN